VFGSCGPGSIGMLKMRRTSSYMGIIYIYAFIGTMNHKSRHQFFPSDCQPFTPRDPPHRVLYQGASLPCLSE
jgi:hypothetical protein